MPNGYIRPVWILILAFLVPLPRFNRHCEWLESTLKTKASDDVHYINLITHRRTGLPPTVRAPFAYRFLIPYMAARLPFGPYTSLNMINICLWALACAYMMLYLKGLGLSATVFNAGTLFFTCSFPAFYYTAIGYVDTWPVLCATWALYFWPILAKPLPVFLFFTLAVVGKESCMALLPFLVASAFVQNPANKSAAIKVMLAGLAGILAATLLARGLAPSHKTDFIWLPNLESMKNNLLKIRTLPSLFLGLGIQGTVVLAVLAIGRGRQVLMNQWPLLVGFGGFLVLWGFALVAAYADARPLWPAMVFSTSLFCHYWAVARNGWQGNH